jgi:hypothetical protein
MLNKLSLSLIAINLVGCAHSWDSQDPCSSYGKGPNNGRWADGSMYARWDEYQQPSYCGRGTVPGKAIYDTKGNRIGYIK